MNECPFCRDYENTLEINAKSIDELGKEGIKRRYKYRVRLIEISENYLYSWQKCGEYDHRARRLVYCPECGKRLVKVK